MNYKYYIVLAVLFCFNSCAPKESTLIQSFIDEYGSYNFHKFKNYDVFVRAYENRGQNACVMVINSKDTGYCALPLAFIIQKSTLSVLEIRRNDTEEQYCKLDTAIARQLAVELLHMGINGIGVDANDNIFINIRFNEEQTAELVRLSDKRFFTGVYRKNYKPIFGNWYKRED